MRKAGPAILASFLSFLFALSILAHAYASPMRLSKLVFTVRDGALINYEGSGRIVKIPEGVKKIDFSFHSDEIEIIEIPASVEDISPLAFYLLPNIRQIKTDPKNSVYSAENGALINVLTGDLIAFIAPEKERRIALPAAVKTIGAHSLLGEDFVESIYIPSSVMEIEPQSFIGCANLEEFEISFENPNYCVYDGVLYSKDKTKAVSCPPGIKSEHIALESSVNEICSSAFAYCSNIKDIDFGKNLKIIGKESFYACESLESAVFPETLAFIGKMAFARCSRLKSAHFSSGIEFIDNTAFSFCPNFEAANIREGGRYLSDEGVAYRIDDDGNLNLWLYPMGKHSQNYRVLDGTALIEADSCMESEWLKGISLPNTVREIGANAFYNSGLTSVRLPDSVEKIFDFAFNGCLSMKDIYIPNSVKSIKPNAFSKPATASPPFSILTNSFYISRFSKLIGCIVNEDELIYDYEDIRTSDYTIYIDGKLSKLPSSIIKNELYLSLEGLADSMNISYSDKTYLQMEFDETFLKEGKVVRCPWVFKGGTFYPEISDVYIAHDGSLFASVETVSSSLGLDILEIGREAFVTKPK
ncbi:MAG: leucine-rich repeat domain-containing protein [Clostridiales bacterium]|jgi:hypothetical protein|nr:leucine-rich repeat domain-containing protein [Clostridiales bacterium]